jgi:hypothetical protein
MFDLSSRFELGWRHISTNDENVTRRCTRSANIVLELFRA